jgi:myo-inositol 2-dehydrogenase/D-chiro-inositol 1-dehydrogenase
MKPSPTRTKVRIGVAGLGRLGKHHAENLVYRVKKAEVVAACSIVPEELEYAKSELGIDRVFNDYREMLREIEMDAVFLVTSTPVHGQQIIDALEAGYDVFCEKPLALTMEECDRVLAVADQYPERLVTIGFVRRYDPSYAYAKQKIDEGAIGDPILFRSHSADMDDTAAFQVEFSKTSGGVFLDASIHDMDLARWMLGSEVETVYCVGGCYLHPGFEQHQDADNATALYRFKNGAVASITISRTAVHGQETHAEIIGTKGSLLIGRPPRKNHVEIYDAGGVRTECVRTFYERFEEAFQLEAEEFVNCILAGRPPRVSLRDAAEATRVALAATQSYRSGDLARL